MRRPTLTNSDLIKGLRKLGNMLHRPATNPANHGGIRPAVYQPKMIPFNDIAIFRRFNQKSVARALKYINSTLGGQLPIIVTTIPNACDYVDLIPSQRIIYYCVDDFSEWPGLDKDLILSMEEQLLMKADRFIATSPVLKERLACTGKPTFLLSHGVDIELFATESTSELDALKTIPNPRVGYFGLFDDRSDQQLIADVAEQLPDVSFVIAGRVETAIDKLRDKNNVYFVGPVPYADLPSLIKGIDVLFIPYVVNALTDALSPLKFKEYLATGLPILTTPIAAADDFKEHIEIAQSANAWHAYINAVLTEERGLRKPVRLKSLEGESWQQKANLFLKLCLE